MKRVLEFQFVFSPSVDGAQMLASKWDVFPPISQPTIVQETLRSYGNERLDMAVPYFDFDSAVDFHCAYEDLVGVACPMSLDEAIVGFDFFASFLDGRLLMCFVYPDERGIYLIRGYCLGGPESDSVTVSRKAS